MANLSHNESDNWRNYKSYSGPLATEAERWKQNKYTFSHNDNINNTSTFRLNPTFREKIGRYLTLNVSYNFQYQLRDRDVLNYTTDDTYATFIEKIKPKSSSS